MNKAISKVFIVSVVLFVALIVNLTWIMVVRAQWFQDRPENKRSIAKEMKIKRGDIVGFDGSVIAGTERRSGYYYRDYPNGHAGAAARRLRLDALRTQRHRGAAERRAHRPVERPRRAELGRQAAGAPAQGRRRQGSPSCRRCRRSAQQALRGQKGAIVVLDPKTGALIASASAPTYDPANLEDQWARLSKDTSAPLLNRPTQGLYVPGSAFKVVTASAGLDTGKVTPDTQFVDTGTYVVFGGKVTNYGGEVFGPNNFTYALTASINTTFAKVGNMLGRKRLIAGAQRLRLLPEAAAAAAGRRDRGQRPLRQEGPALAGRLHGPARRGLGGVRPGAGCSPRRCRWRSSPAAWPTAAAS